MYVSNDTLSYPGPGEAGPAHSLATGLRHTGVEREDCNHEPRVRDPRQRFLHPEPWGPHAQVARSSSAGSYRETGRPGDHFPWGRPGAGCQAGRWGRTRARRSGGREVTPFPRGDPESNMPNLCIRSSPMSHALTWPGRAAVTPEQVTGVGGDGVEAMVLKGPFCTCPTFGCK